MANNLKKHPRHDSEVDCTAQRRIGCSSERKKVTNEENKHTLILVLILLCHCLRNGAKCNVMLNIAVQLCYICNDASCYAKLLQSVLGEHGCLHHEGPGNTEAGSRAQLLRQVVQQGMS